MQSLWRLSQKSDFGSVQAVNYFRNQHVDFKGIISADFFLSNQQLAARFAYEIVSRSVFTQTFKGIVIKQ
jgi:hypothetical protein